MFFAEKPLPKKQMKLTFPEKNVFHEHLGYVKKTNNNINVARSYQLG